MKYGVFTSRRRQSVFFIALAFSFAGLGFPWFSFNPEMTGYRWGYAQGFPAVIAGIAALLACFRLGPGRKADLAVTGLLAFAPAWYLYRFFTWHVLTVTGELSLRISLRVTYPGFYASLALSLAPTAAYWLCRRRG